MNVAYRGASGWTTEQDLVSGIRATPEQVAATISSSLSYFLIHRADEEIISCINIELQNQIAYIGSFAVAPTVQATGIGSRVIEAAEKYAKERFCVKKFTLVVLSPRKELIAFYERRGYKRTGKISSFPIHMNVGLPKTANLVVEELEKHA